MSNSYQITGDLLTKLGHRLLATFYAAYEFENLYRESGPLMRDPDPLDHLREFEDSDISECLITLASLARAEDDQWETLKYGDIAFPDGVGTLTKSKKTTPLKVREACNKIIHATSMSYDLSKTNEHPVWGKWYRAQKKIVSGDYLAPAIKVSGASQSGIPWKARIELIPYVYSVSIPSINAWALA